METVDLHRGCIDFIFENCECITVDMWAIKYFHFDVKEERWIWDKDHKNFLKTNQVDDFNLVLDISDPKHFSQTIRMTDPDKTIEEMGKYCIDRLTNSDDISGFTINGKDYTVPWNRHEKPTDVGIPLILNTFQRNTASVNKCGEATLQIQIKEESDGSGENQEKH